MKICKQILVALTLFLALSCRQATKSQSMTTLERAKEAYSLKNWANVNKFYSALVENSQYNGDFHYRIGRANFMLENYDKSKEHFQLALKNGVSTNNGYALYYLARIEGRLGNADKCYGYLSETLDYAASYIEVAKKQKDFEKFFSHQKFKTLLGIPKDNYDNRISAWRDELHFLKNRMEKSHYDIFHYTSKENWETSIQKLYNDIPILSDNKIMIRLAEIGALAMDGHSYVSPLFGSKLEVKYHVIPLEYYYFSDALMIRAANKNYASLVGKEVVAIGGRELSEIEEELYNNPIVGLDNDFQFKWQTPWFLRIPELLFAKDLINSEEYIELTLKNKNGELISQKVYPNEIMNETVMKSAAPENWINMNSSSLNPTPLYLKKTNTTFWLEHMSEENLTYIQINNIRDMENETMEEFTARFLNVANKKGARAIVLDVRLNNGGNANVAQELVKRILKSDYNMPNKLFIIIGRNTFSATMPPIAVLDKWSEAIFVGEPTGTRPNFIAEGNMMELPYSGMFASASNNYWQGGFNSNDSRWWIAPEIGAEPNIEDYTNNVDSSISSILKYLDEQNK